MTEERHPDIEIYVKNRAVADIEAWLNNCFEQLSDISHKGLIHEYQATLNGESIPVLIHEKVVGKAWVSVWFNSDQTPWQKDLDCAVQASADMETQIRCIASGWNTGDEPDEWWKVENGNQEQIIWRTE